MNEDVWRQVLDREKAGRGGVQIEDEESEEEAEEDIEMEDDGWGDREFVSDISGVCKSGDTRRITSSPRNVASRKTNSLGCKSIAESFAI